MATYRVEYASLVTHRPEHANVVADTAQKAVDTVRAWDKHYHVSGVYLYVHASDPKDGWETD